jgi:hypothetical protein
MTSFPKRLKELSDRVRQILSYHRIDPDNVESHEIIAHFTGWRACEKMLSAAKTNRGLTLWAGDANCLNDPLEGGALIKYAEDIADALQSGEEPIKSIAEDDAAMWKNMKQIVHDLYPSPPRSAARWYVPRPIPSSQVYLVSFCKDKDRLDLWRAYGEQGEGVCMVMPLKSAATLVEKTADWRFYKVMYGGQDIRALGHADETEGDSRFNRVTYEQDYFTRAWVLLAKPLEEVWDESKKLPSTEQPAARKEIVDSISPVLHLYKHYEFQTENEIRLVYYRVNAKPEIEKIRDNERAILKTRAFFLKAKDCKIVLGPRAPDRNHRIAYLRARLGQLFTNDLLPEVEISRVPYQ